MPVALFPYIATRSTANFVVPARASSQDGFNRNVSNAFSGLIGGHLTAGNIVFRPVSAALANHLLCDGSILEIDSFPDLYEAIGTMFGGDGLTTFALPDYINAALETAPTAPTQTTDDGGTVTNEDGTVTEPTDPGETGGTTGGNTPSGGRPGRDLNGPIP